MHADRRLPEGSFSPLKAIQQEKKKEMREKQVAKGLEQAKKTVNTSMSTSRVESEEKDDRDMANL